MNFFPPLPVNSKTTLLYKLKEQRDEIFTIGFAVEVLVSKGTGLSFYSWDVGECGKHRPLWRCYFAIASIVIFVIDSVDRERLADSVNEELDRALLDSNNPPVLLVANKQDLSNALSTDQIEDILHLDKKKLSIVLGTWSELVRPIKQIWGQAFWRASDTF